MRKFIFILLTFCLLFGIDESFGDVDNEVWTFLTPMPIPRTEVATVAINENIYVIGGYDINGKGTDTVQVFNTTNNSWSVVSPVPNTVNHVGAAWYKNEIYIVGGYDSVGPTNDLFIYNVTDNSWKIGPPLPTPRGALTAQIIDGMLYVVGGQNKLPLPTNEVFNLLTQTWDTKSPMPTPREHLTSSIIDGKMYVIGGRYLNPGNNYANVEVYDPQPDTWDILENMPTPRGGLASTTYNGTIFVFGGESWTEAFGNNEQYIPNQGWQIHLQMQVPRHGLGAVTVDDTIYVIGGGAAAGLSVSGINESYSISSFFLDSSPQSTVSPPFLEQKESISSEISNFNDYDEYVSDKFVLSLFFIFGLSITIAWLISRKIQKKKNFIS